MLVSNVDDLIDILVRGGYWGYNEHRPLYQKPAVHKETDSAHSKGHRRKRGIGVEPR